MDAREWLAVVALGVTVGGVIVRPGGVHEGMVAMAGAAVALALGLITPVEVWRAAVRDLDIIAFFLGLMLLASGGEAAGVAVAAAVALH